MRLLAVSLFLQCHNRTQVANQLKVARSSVNLWVSSYLEQGLAGLEDKPRPGKKPSLSNEQKRRLARYIEFKAQSDEGGRLTGADIQQYISSEFNVEYHPNHIYKLLKSMRFCWITSRSRHPKQTQSLQDAFKKVSSGNDPSHSHSYTTSPDWYLVSGRSQIRPAKYNDTPLGPQRQ